MVLLIPRLIPCCRRCQACGQADRHYWKTKACVPAGRELDCQSGYYDCHCCRESGWLAHFASDHRTVGCCSIPHPDRCRRRCGRSPLGRSVDGRCGRSPEYGGRDGRSPRSAYERCGRSPLGRSVDDRCGRSPEYGGRDGRLPRSAYERCGRSPLGRSVDDRCGRSPEYGGARRSITTIRVGTLRTIPTWPIS